MQSQNKVAYFGALSLLLSYFEMMLPRFIPFLKLGLSNSVVLLALDFDIQSFAVLLFVKNFAVCLTAGTLFSPFFLISLCQTISSGFLMFAMNKMKGRWISVFGISIFGSVASGIAQILLCSLYLGRGVFSFLGIVTVFSIFSGIVTAVASKLIHIPDNFEFAVEKTENASEEKKFGPKFLVFVGIFLVATFASRWMWLSVALAISALVLQKCSGRKILILPYVGLWSFVLISCLISPSGKVLFDFHGFSLTDGALLLGIQKALKLTAAFSISQVAANIKFKNPGIIALTLSYFDQILSEKKEQFKKTNGNIFAKIKATI